MDVMDVKCPFCHAEAGSLCVTKKGVPSGSHPHQKRVTLVTTPVANPEPASEGFSDQTTLAVWERHRDSFLWGIQFARNTMRMSQDQIDERLAEMWADLATGK
jgi:hypothetical protein